MIFGNASNTFWESHLPRPPTPLGKRSAMIPKWPLTCAAMDGLLRHIAACRNARLPGARRAFRLGGVAVGWVAPALAARLLGIASFRAHDSGIDLAEPARLAEIAAALAAEGLFTWRGEAFDVRAVPEGEVLARVDRGALPVFGLHAEGVHVNGLVRRGGGVFLWVARRAMDRPLDPGKLDHLVAGGIPAGFTPWRTLIKEAAEEAAIPAALAARARRVAVLDYAMERPEGLRRDRLHGFDLDLPEDFVPRAADGEAAGFELWPLAAVLDAVVAGDDFKFNVNLVLIDLFLRRNLIDPLSPDGRRLRAALAGADAAG